jgi:hypothetical protein
MAASVSSPTSAVSPRQFWYTGAIPAASPNLTEPICT